MDSKGGEASVRAKELGTASGAFDHQDARRAREDLLQLLRGLRTLSKHITREDDATRLQQSVCDALVGDLGYLHAWVGRLGASGALEEMFETGLASRIPDYGLRAQQALPRCARIALEEDRAQMVEHTTASREDCSLAACTGAYSMTAPIRFGGAHLGVLSVAAPADRAISRTEELELVAELADELGYALHRIDAAKERIRVEQALRETAAHLRAVEQVGGVGFWEARISENRVWLSPAMQKMLGLAEAQQSIDQLRAMLAMDGADQALAVFFAHAQSAPGAQSHPEGSSNELTLLLPNGEVRTFLSHFRVAEPHVPATSRIVGVSLDITERVRMHKAIEESERKYRTLLDHVPDFIMRFDLQARHRFVSESLQSYVPVPLERVLGKSHRELGLAEDLCGAWERHLGYVYRTKMPSTFRHGYQSVRGPVTFEWHLVPELEEDAVVSVLAVGRDITEKERAERALAESHSRLRELATQLAIVEERERHKLATYLHDQVGQSLALLRLQLGVLSEIDDAQKRRRVIEELRGLLAEVLEDCRTVTFDLSPPILYELGLVPALERLCEHFEAVHHLPTQFVDDGLEHPLAQDVSVFLYRAMRELLVNVVKHARAQHVRVELRNAEHEGHAEVHLSVADDGIGIAPPSGKRGFGIFSIREHAHAIGGRLEHDVNFAPGTKVLVAVPARSTPLGAPSTPAS